jgi:mitochondrial enoyl-[acyl-carrier protein] reductase / trans-2-enoyl-CoA reductase
MKKVSAIVYHEYGDPASVLRVEQVELPEPQAGEVRVRMEAAPINPADLNTVEGKYPIRPPLPATPGVEGAGVIEAFGEGVGDLKIGDRVLVPHGVGSWCEACICKAEGVVKVPSGIASEQAAMLKINPATAWRMLHDFVDLKPGDWVIQNAANSGVGRAVIQIAKQLGIKTVNVVRRAELIVELDAEGADVVLIDGDDLRAQVAERTGKAKIPLALNAVGGESALNIANVLAAHGTHVTYGAMGRQPVRLPNGLLIFKDISFRGFWVSNWYSSASAEAKNEMFKNLFDFATRGILKTKVEKKFAIGDVREAVARALQGGRDGKIIFAFGG